MDMHTFFRNKDLAGLSLALSENPALANEELACHDGNPAKAHPLHRICDGVIGGIYTDEDAVEMAKVFVKYGARVDGNQLLPNRDSPLVAAASLHAEKTGILYIEHGATIDHPGCHGGTALHWAAWTGRHKLVEKLIEAKAPINKLCVEFKSTPLLWALHGYRFGGRDNRHHQITCARLLLEAGADKTIPNFEGYLPIQFVEEEESELKALLV